MAEIPEPVIKMIKHPESRKVLTTVTPDGKPHAIVCASLHTAGTDTIVAAEVFMHRTVENLMANPNVEILVWLGKDAYSIKAVVDERQTEGEIFDKMSAYMEKFNMSTVAIWKFKALEIWDESASRTAGEKVV